MTHILGISAYYHDSAACLVRDGTVVAAAQEERFTRKKHDPGFPEQAVRYCLREGGIALKDVRYVAFYDKPLLKFERLLETYLAFAPNGLRSFVTAMPVWLKEKLFLKSLLRKELAAVADGVKTRELPPLLFGEHHESHAASAFFPSPFDAAAVLCMDGVGEWATTSAWLGDGHELTALWEIPFPHSLGLLYSAFTYYTGFKVNSGEYKVMGLAPYGRPKYVQAIYEHLIDLKPDGTFRLNLDFFNYCTGLTMTNARFDTLFGGPPRKPETHLTQRDMDLARSIQDVTEEVMLRLARTLHRETGARNLCLAGGVALNCVGNGRILREGPFEGSVDPARGGRCGRRRGRGPRPRGIAWRDSRAARLEMACAGRTWARRSRRRRSNASCRKRTPRTRGWPTTTWSTGSRTSSPPGRWSAGSRGGWNSARGRSGPGAFSVMPGHPQMQSVMNLKIKFRESFRPFAPAVLRDRVRDYFELDTDSPYMLLVAPVLEKRRLKASRGGGSPVGHRTPARAALGHSGRHARGLLRAHPNGARRDESALSRASQGLRGQDRVWRGRQHLLQRAGRADRLHPADAYRCFMRTNIDVLVLENCLLDKAQQPPLVGDTDWRKEFELD